MTVQIESTALRQTKWYEYAVRFVFGGLITAVAGLIAQHFGPAVGGLFLAFPAIFPASATLIEKHTREKAGPKSKSQTKVGGKIVADDSEGAALGTLGLVTFAVFVWQLVMNYPAALVLAGAVVVWVVVSLVAWKICTKFFSAA